MATLTIASPETNSGKSAIAAGLSRKLGGGTDIQEAPAGDLPASRTVIVVVTLATDPAATAAYAKGAGVIVNRVPEAKAAKIRAAYEAAGVKVLGVVPEDRIVASPTIGEFAAALEATGAHIEENADTPIDPVIASIAADPGQGYFIRTDANAVIVRSDKPDLQLAALNAGATCLILTGGLPVLSYVLQRVEEDEVPLLNTRLDTKKVVDALEDLFAASPFKRTDIRLRRIDQLLAGVNVDSLLQPSQA